MSLTTQCWPRAKHCCSVCHDVFVVDAILPQGQTAAPTPVLFCNRGIDSICSPFTSGGQDFWLLLGCLRKPLGFSVDCSKRCCQGTAPLQLLLCIYCANRPLFSVWWNFICYWFLLYPWIVVTMNEMFWAFNLHSVKNLNFYLFFENIG